MSPLDNTRIGEVFASIEARMSGINTPAEEAAAMLDITRMTAGAYALEVVSLAIAAESLAEKRPEAAKTALLRYIEFLALVNPALFATRDAANKTRLAIRMAVEDARDMIGKRG